MAGGLKRFSAASAAIVAERAGKNLLIGRCAAPDQGRGRFRRLALRNQGAVI